jgi:NNP family nitrate/nitrite transporter-like MFS transporter
LFLVLFFCSGIGNGSTYRMIPIIFRTEKLRGLKGVKPGSPAYDQAARESNKESATVIGFVAAMAAYGAFFVPKSYGTAIALTGSPLAALYVFLAFYATCVAVTWWYYSRKDAEVPC